MITLDSHEDKQSYARQQLSRAGLSGVVTFRLGDARESLAALDESVDFVLLDLWKHLYVPCFDLFYPKLSRGALVVADNMIFPETTQPSAALYRQHVRAKAGIQSMLLPVGSGLEISRCVRGLDPVTV